MNKSDYSLITITFRNFRKACRHHIRLSTRKPERGICQQSDETKRCYRRRCPMLKGVTL